MEAAKHYYAFDLAPGFWETLARFASQGRIRSVDPVKVELVRGGGYLAKWASNDFAHAFASIDDQNVFQEYERIIEWVENQNQFFDAAKAQFAKGADGWLIAYAKVNGYVVVTLEVLNPAIKRKVPIPNICQEFHVPYVDTFEMLKDLGLRLIPSF